MQIKNFLARLLVSKRVNKLRPFIGSFLLEACIALSIIGIVMAGIGASLDIFIVNTGDILALAEEVSNIEVIRGRFGHSIETTITNMSLPGILPTASGANVGGRAMSFSNGVINVYEYESSSTRLATAFELYGNKLDNAKFMVRKEDDKYPVVQIVNSDEEKVFEFHHLNHLNSNFVALLGGNTEVKGNIFFWKTE